MGKSATPLTQWRQIDGHGVDAKEEVQPEAPILGLLPEVPIGCADQPCIDPPRLLRSHARKGAILQHLQQLCLNRQIQAAHFIEKQRSQVRKFHASALGCIRTGEGSLFIAEQLRLDERKWNRRTGHLDPGAFRPIGARMQQLGKDLLACPALPLQQNRDGRIRNTFQLLAGSRHHG